MIWRRLLVESEKGAGPHAPMANTEGDGPQSVVKDAIIGDQLLQGLAHGFAAVPFWEPAERADASGIETDDRDISAPAAGSAGVFKGGPVEIERCNG
jgi:hypothetical protein